MGSAPSRATEVSISSAPLPSRTTASETPPAESSITCPHSSDAAARITAPGCSLETASWNRLNYALPKFCFGSPCAGANRVNTLAQFFLPPVPQIDKRGQFHHYCAHGRLEQLFG